MHGVLEYEVFNLAFLEPLDQDIIEGIFLETFKTKISKYFTK